MDNEIEQVEEAVKVDDESSYIEDAKEMGWQSKDHFKGKEEEFVSAKEFVERGEHLLPLIKATNKRLKGDLLTRDGEIATLKQAVESQQKAIKALQKSYTLATQKEVEKAKIELRQQIKDAREMGDTDTELDLQDKMQTLRNAEKEAKTEDVVETPPANRVSPDFASWQKENPWYGDASSVENRKRSKELLRIGEDLMEDGETLRDRAFLDKCLDILKEREGGKDARRSTSKVESAGSRGHTVASGGFNSLPKDAKDACHSDNDSFVGPGKMFKTVKEWEDHYYSLYNEE